VPVATLALARWGEKARQTCPISGPASRGIGLVDTEGVFSREIVRAGRARRRATVAPLISALTVLPWQRLQHFAVTASDWANGGRCSLRYGSRSRMVTSGA